MKSKAVCFVSWIKPLENAFKVGNSVIPIEDKYKGGELVNMLIEKNRELEPGAIILSFNRVK